jgi:hypothetical protein
MNLTYVFALMKLNAWTAEIIARGKVVLWSNKAMRDDVSSQ